MKEKEYILNICFKDNKCLLYGVLASLYPVDEDKDETQSHVWYKDKLDVSMLNYPVKTDSALKNAKRQGI